MSSSKQSRLQQLIEWCGGPGFEGCLIFDECHKAKNFVPVSVYTKISLMYLNKTKVQNQSVLGGYVMAMSDSDT